MNPMDYWYGRDEKVRAYLDGMYEERIGSAVLSKELAEDMRRLYREGAFTEKSLVLTVLSAVHLYFEGGTAKAILIIMAHGESLVHIRNEAYYEETGGRSRFSHDL